MIFKKVHAKNYVNIHEHLPDLGKWISETTPYLAYCIEFVDNSTLDNSFSLIVKSENYEYDIILYLNNNKKAKSFSVFANSIKQSGGFDGPEGNYNKDDWQRIIKEIKSEEDAIKNKKTNNRDLSVKYQTMKVEKDIDKSYLNSLWNEEINL